MITRTSDVVQTRAIASFSARRNEQVNTRLREFGWNNV
jgi:hypothetical protein